MVRLNFMVCKDKLLDGSKPRTMRPVATKTWQKVYDKWQIILDYLNSYGQNWNGRLDDEEKGTRLGPKIYPISISVYWSPESPCPLCGYYATWPPQKGEYYCVACGKKFQLPTKMFRKKRKLFDAVLTNITKRTLGSLSEEEWKSDGFNDTMYLTARDAGLDWFGNTYKISHFCDLNSGRIVNPPDQLLNFEVFIIEFQRI